MTTAVILGPVAATVGAVVMLAAAVVLLGLVIDGVAGWVRRGR